MKCTCNEFSLCETHYKEYLEKYENFLKECIAELLDKQCKENNLKANSRMLVAKSSPCEITIHHDGTEELLKVIKFAEKQGCSREEMKEAVLDRLSVLNEFKTLLQEVTK